MVNKPINVYRKQLMGIAALGIIFVHSRDIVTWPNFLTSLFGYGGIGVYIFVYLSAIGLFNSLKSRGRGYKKSDFYKRRFQRVFVPYLLIAVTWYGIKYLIFQHDAIGFIYELSTLSFWNNHQGAWYVAMVIPMYLVFPWFFDWVEASNSPNKLTRNRKIVVVCVAASTTVFIISIYNPQLYSHLSQVFSSIIVFLIGYYFADKVMKGEYTGYLVSFMCIIFYVVKAITPLKNLNFISSISWSMLAIPILTVSTLFLSKIKTRFTDSILGFFGKYSLEMYLWNIFLIQAIRYLGIIEWLEKHGDTSGYIAYSLVVVGGITLSVLYERMSESIIKKVTSKNVA